MRYPTFRASSGVKRALLQLACAFLLFAQHMGLAHAIWHAAQQMPAQQQRADERRNDRPISREVSRLCALDVAFAQVLGAGPLAGHDFSAEKPTAETPVHALGAFATSETFTPRSRGPPSLL
jgi:hypothetical protein